MKKNNDENIVPFENNDSFFQNNSGFTNDYIIKSINNDIELTFFEKKLLNQYILTDIGFGFDKDINFNSPLVRFMIDFARWYLEKH
jgi:hypothetical protein